MIVTIIQVYLWNSIPNTIVTGSSRTTLEIVEGYLSTLSSWHFFPTSSARIQLPTSRGFICSRNRIISPVFTIASLSISMHTSDSKKRVKECTWAAHAPRSIHVFTGCILNLAHVPIVIPPAIIFFLLFFSRDPGDRSLPTERHSFDDIITV